QALSHAVPTCRQDRDHRNCGFWNDRDDEELNATLGIGTPRVNDTTFCSARVREMALCHEHHRSKRRCATVREMKEGPSGSAIRSLIPSHRELPWSKAVVVSVAETSGRGSRQARSREASASKLLLKRRKRIRRCQNRG